MKGHTIVKKAWAVTANVENIYEWDLPKIEMAKTAGKAKIAALPEFSGAVLWDTSRHYKHDSWMCSGEYDCGFMDLEVNRAKEYDVVIFRGEEIKRFKIAEIIAKEVRDKRLNDMLKENPGAKAYVKNGNYGSYWGPNHSGYADSVIFAGVYSIDEAVRIVLSSSLDRQESVIIIDTEERNHEIDHEISKLNTEIERLKGQRI